MRRPDLCIAVCALVLDLFTQCPAQESAGAGIKRTLDRFCAAAVARSGTVATYWDLSQADRSLREAARSMDIQPTEAKGSGRFLKNLAGVIAPWAVTCAHPEQIVVTEAPGGKGDEEPTWAWRRVKEVVRTHVDASGMKATASVLMETGRGDLRYVFRLASSRASWKIHDCCRVDGGLWWSELLAAHYISGIHLTQERKGELEQLTGSIHAAGRYLLENVPEVSPFITEILTSARELSPPPLLAAKLDLFEGVLKAREKKTDEALVALRRARKQADDLLEVHHLLGRMEREHSQFASAAKSLHRYAQDWDGDFEPFNELMHTLVDTGQRSAAIEVLEGIVARGSAVESVTDRLVTLLLEEKKTKRAGEIICAALVVRPDARDQLLKAGEWLGRSGANEALLQVATGYLEKKPSSALGIALRAKALRRLGKLAEANQLLGEARPSKNDPDIRRVWRQRAFTHAACAEGGKASEAARLVSERDSSPEFSRFVGAWVGVAKGEVKAAQAPIRKVLLTDHRYGEVLEREPTFRKFRKQRAGKRLIAMAQRTQQFVREAERLRSLGKWNKLLDLAARRVARTKRDHEAHRYKGVALCGLEQRETALAGYRRARKVCPEDTRLFFSRAIIDLLVLLGRVPEALSDATALVIGYPKDPRQLILRTRVHLAGDSPLKAVADLRAALETAPDLAHEVLTASNYATLRKNDRCLKLASAIAGK